MKVQPVKGTFSCGYSVRNFRKWDGGSIDPDILWQADVFFISPDGEEDKLGVVLYRNGRWERGGPDQGNFWNGVRDIAAQKLNELYPNGVPEETPPVDSPSTSA